MIFFILILCGMGIMNLVIGIMCEAAFAILKETEEKDMNKLENKLDALFDGFAPPPELDL